MQNRRVLLPFSVMLDGSRPPPNRAALPLCTTIPTSPKIYITYVLPSLSAQFRVLVDTQSLFTIFGPPTNVRGS
jgi:hypothetical protein